MRYLVLVILSLSLLGACQKDVSKRQETRTQSGLQNDPKIGMMRVQYVDEKRQNWANTGPRPLTTLIWYQTSSDEAAKPFAVPPTKPVFTGGLVVRGAKPADPAKKRPLVLLSHGTGGSAFQTMWLGRRLASAGYIVASIDHHGNTAAEDNYDPRGFRIVTERPKDMSIMLDQLLADKTLAPLIDETSIAAIGFSLGGYTVLSMAGGRIDFSQMEKFCASNKRDATCEPQSEFPDAQKLMMEMADTDPRIALFVKEHTKSFLDPRIDYVAALAPALGGAFTRESLLHINIPVRVIAGADDQTVPVETNAKTIAGAIPGARLDVIEGGITHYIFLNECTKRGRKYVPLCKDAKGVDRAKIHDYTVGLILSDLQAVFPNAP